MMKNPKIGLLPLYIELYDSILPELRAQMIPFVDQVCSAFKDGGVDVVQAPICCVKNEVQAALDQLNKEGVDLVATLHLAYSPSLEAAELLAATPQPLMLLSTTPDADFSPAVDPDRLLQNHGIHGVQDLGSMLRRYGKPYEVVAGHLSEPRMMKRAIGLAKAARAASLFKNMKALCIGGQFVGMGDFQVEPAVLKEIFGIEFDTIAPEELASTVGSIAEEEVEAERLLDLDRYEGEIDLEVHRRSIRLGLGLRKYIEDGGYGAFSMNFNSFQESEGLVNTVPFLECSKAMERGTGYAGEGDILTASLVGALEQAFGMTSFTEMFCSDWAGNSLFLSHMGEFNPELSVKKPFLHEQEYTLSNARNPAALGMAPQPGTATYINLSPGPDNTFRLIISLVEVLEDGTHPDIAKSIRGWIRPELPVAEFLEAYSQLGGTHHSAMIMGDHAEAVAAFARMAGMEACRL